MKEDKSVWDKSIKVEESGYYWNKTNRNKEGEIPKDKPIVVDYFAAAAHIFRI